MSEDERREFLRRRLGEVRDRIERARRDAGRSDDVGLTVVTKTYPASDVDLLAELGVRDVGENRDQEAKVKRDEVRARDLRWHMIGQLQRNKAASVARWADVVESVDRLALVEPLARAVRQSGREDPLSVLVQVSLDPPGAANRGGVAPEDLPILAEAIERHRELALHGVMAVAPNPQTGVTAFAAFRHLRDIVDRFQALWPAATTVSAGMSDDLEAAIACGATQVRIGGAILGPRPVVQ